ncbi:MAG: hypothetical protein EBU46_06920 [Nitrosomonadaceae bacterium]|nr:hypothetical protein [Nitrosomonadaceae bacterium]
MAKQQEKGEQSNAKLAQLEADLAQLQGRLEFQRLALYGGFAMTAALVMTGIACLVIGAWTLKETGKAIFTGFHSGALMFLGIPALAVYYAFVFGREASIHVKIADKKMRLPRKSR